MEEEPLEETVGRLADVASNYLVYGENQMASLPDRMRIEAMATGLQELQDELRILSIKLGADPNTWS
jgi:hypothetical protein